MTIRTSCSACGVKLKVEDRLAGKTVRCPGCQQSLVIPASQVAEEIYDPFAEDAEALVSPPSPPSLQPPAKRRAVENESAVRSPQPAPLDQPPAAPRPAKPTPKTKPQPAADLQTPTADAHVDGEFPHLSDEDLRGEPISPPRRRKKPPGSNLDDNDSAATPAAKSPRRTRQLTDTSATHTGWRWHLHWILAVALLPLILSNTFSSNVSLEDRLNKTIENHPELNPETLGSGSLNDFVMQLPDHRIEGAWLPADTSWHWAMALASSGVFLGLLVWMWPDGDRRSRMLITAGLATGTVGIMLLLGFQWLALQTDGVFLRGRGIVILLFYIVKLIGFSYQCAVSTDSGFLQSFMGYTLGVGLCEELCKALPVVIYLLSDPHKQRLRTACLIGLASGVGFGVSEGITYAVEYYNGITDFWIYLVRFISCVSLHAIWAGGVAILMSTNQDHLSFSWGDALGFVAFYLSPAMILHGLYNTLLTHGYDHIAAACAVASFLWFQWLLWRHASEA